MPLHIACLHHMTRMHSKLFILAHELVDREPESHISWYAVGVWYMSVKKYSDARTYFRSESYPMPALLRQLNHIAVKHHLWTLASHRHGWHSRIHLPWKASTIMLSQHTQLALVCSAGECIPHTVEICSSSHAIFQVTLTVDVHRNGTNHPVQSSTSGRSSERCTCYVRRGPVAG